MSTATKPSAPQGVVHIEPEQPTRVFRVFSWLLALLCLAGFVFGLTEVVVMWLPDDTLYSVIDDLQPGDLRFRVHWMHIGIVAWALLPPMLAQLRRPQHRVAQMLQLWFGTAILVLVLVVSGGLELVDLILLALVSTLLALHPARRNLLRRPRFDSAQLLVAAVGAVPWLVRSGFAAADAWDAAELPGALDVSAQVFWANVAIAPALLVMCALVGATDFRGWRLPAWTAALGSVLLGTHALVFPDSPGSVAMPWAVAAVAWGIAYGATSVRRTILTDGR